MISGSQWVRSWPNCQVINDVNAVVSRGRGVSVLDPGMRRCKSSRLASAVAIVAGESKRVALGRAALTC